MTYALLFYEFFKTGLFAVGGGLATLPFLYDLCAKRPNWLTTAQLADMIAVSESTPGPIGVNMATYVGFHVAGFGGAITATLGLICPSLIIILLVAAFLKSFRNNRFVNAAFYGLRPASTAMIAAAGLSVAEMTMIDETHTINGRAVVLASVLLVLTRWVKPTRTLHPLWFLLLSAVAGVIFA